VDKKHPDFYPPSLAIEKEANMHVSIHELPSQHSPIDPTSEPILSALSSVYSSDGKQSPCASSSYNSCSSPNPSEHIQRPSKLLH
jgi:hypothetical protein